MKRILVDSSAWFAYVAANDPFHEPVRRALEGWKGRLVAHGYIFDEVVTLVRARAGHPLACRVGEILQRQDVVDLVRVTPDDEESAWEQFRRQADKDFSFTDCVSFAVMRRLNIDRAATLDRDFRQAGFETEPDSPAGWLVSEAARPFEAANGKGERVRRRKGTTSGRVAIIR